MAGTLPKKQLKASTFRNKKKGSIKKGSLMGLEWHDKF